MARNQATYSLDRSVTYAQIEAWFRKQGFQQVGFTAGVFETSVDVGAQPIFHKLKERPGYATFYREAKGGAILVFEVQLQEKTLLVEAYAPMLVFGMVRKELAFKPKGGLLTPYLKQGYQVWAALGRFLDS
ncbi:MAG: hypothetical protein AAF399_22935 [Bacteroidota bacterium]